MRVTTLLKFDLRENMNKWIVVNADQELRRNSVQV